MRVFSTLLVSVALAVSCISLAFSYLQAKQEESRLMAELDRKASLLLEGFLEVSGPTLAQLPSDRRAELLNRFASRDQVLGLAFFDANAQPTVSSDGFTKAVGQAIEDVRQSVSDAISIKVGRGAVLAGFGRLLHVYSAPISAENGKSATAVSVVSDAGGIRSRIHRIWTQNFMRALAQSSPIS